uniref:chorismate mutase n=1 Tax=Pararhizobium sp. IMCC3301 TaxID=3067904 RepID=UPI0027412097|nr:chorismate mutase [Pararhizobium sp. IMCC3301]
MTPTPHADPKASKVAALQELAAIRGSIDNIDAAVIHMLAERFKCTKRVGILKAENDLPASDPDREQQQIERLRALAVEADLDAEFAEKFLNFIVREVIQKHLALRS